MVLVDVVVGGVVDVVVGGVVDVVVGGDVVDVVVGGVVGGETLVGVEVVSHSVSFVELLQSVVIVVVDVVVRD